MSFCPAGTGDADSVPAPACCCVDCRFGRSDARPPQPGRYPSFMSVIEALEKRLREALNRFDTALEPGTTGGVDSVKKHGEPWIKVSPLGKQEEPENLVALKAEIERRWGTVDLIDVLKEAEFATGFTSEFTSVATREAVPKAGGGLAARPHRPPPAPCGRTRPSGHRSDPGRLPPAVGRRRSRPGRAEPGERLRPAENSTHQGADGGGPGLRPDRPGAELPRLPGTTAARRPRRQGPVWARGRGDLDAAAAGPRHRARLPPPTRRPRRNSPSPATLARSRSGPASEREASTRSTA